MTFYSSCSHRKYRNREDSTKRQEFTKRKIEAVNKIKLVLSSKFWPKVRESVNNLKLETNSILQ